MKRVEQTDGCICRWEIGPVLIERPEEDDFTQLMVKSSFGPGIRYVREAKHYISTECPMHRELLRPVAQRMLDDYKQKYPGVVALAERLAAGVDGLEQGGSETEEAVYFEFSQFRLRVPKDAVMTGKVNVSTAEGGGLPVAQGLAYQFFNAEEAVKWANEQAAWLVWKFYADDPKTLPGHERSWIGVWDGEDPYFLPTLGDHCARCHHVCSRYCWGMPDTLKGDHGMEECTQHWMGCPGC